MQSLLVICAICLQLNNLPNSDLQALEQRDIACNQCLTSLNMPTMTEIPLTMENSCPEQVLQCDCMGSDSDIMSEETPEIDLRVSKDISVYGEEIGAILEDKKSSLASLVHRKMQELAIMVRYKSSQVSDYHMILDLFQEEEARLIEIYTEKLDEVVKTIAVNYDPLNPTKAFVNEFAIKMWQLSSMIERLLLDKRIETLRKHLEQVGKSEKAVDELRTLIERRDIPIKFKDYLMVHQVLAPGHSLASENGFYEAIMQADGNFVIYDLLYRPTWHSNTYHLGKKIHMRPDGNLAIYNVRGEMVWSTGNEASMSGTMYYVKLENDGRLIMYHSEGHVMKEITKMGHL